MAGKKVAFGGKPKTKAVETATKDDWVKNREAEPVKMKRFTIDVPEELHRRIKADCASRGVKMATEIRVLLERHFE